MPYHEVINDPSNYRAASGTELAQERPTYGSAREAYNATKLHASPYLSAPHNVAPIRSEYSLRRARPYVERRLGPDGHGLAPENSTMRALRGFADVYQVSSGVPQAKVVRALQRAGWAREAIDAALPQYVYDRRLDAVAGGDALVAAMRAADMKMQCPWMPLRVNRKMIEAGAHVRYCAMVCRLYTLERLMCTLRSEHARYSKVDYNEANLHAFEKSASAAAAAAAEAAACGEEKRALDTRKRAVVDAIRECGKWQDTMMGAALYMEDTGRYSDALFEGRAPDGRRGSAHHEVGLHWVMHEGELPDISTLIPHLAYWSPVEQRRRAKNVRGRCTEAGAIGDMRGTPFENDLFVCAVLNIVKHGVPQPSQLRNADVVIVLMLRKLMGRNENDVDQAMVARTEFSDTVDLMSDVFKEHVEATRELDADTRRGGKFRGCLRTEALKDKHSWLVAKRAEFIELAREKFNALMKYSNARVAGSDATLARAVRVNKRTLQTALANSHFENVVQCGRRFLGYREMRVNMSAVREGGGGGGGGGGYVVSGSDDDDDDDECDELYLNLFGDTQMAQELTRDSGGGGRGGGGGGGVGGTAAGAGNDGAARSDRASTRSRWIPKWSSAKQKHIQSRDHTVSTPNGGHNAHRLLDFMIRILGATLLGCFDLCEMRPNFFTCKEVYRLIQYDYPGIEDFCAWVETPFPEDLQKHAPDTPEEKCDADGIPFDYKNGSDYRRYFIVYMMREYHLHSLYHMTGFWQRFEALYRWDVIVRNITETCDALRFFVNKFIRDYYVHKRTCGNATARLLDDRDTCSHCVRWQHAKQHFTPRLVRLYKRWPILFAVDMAARWRIDPATGTSAADVGVTYVHDRHKMLMHYCWRSSLRSFYNNMCDNFANIDKMMADRHSLASVFSPKPTKAHLLTRAQLQSLSADAARYFENAENYYKRNLEARVRRLVNAVIQRFPPRYRVGYDWLTLCGVKLRSVAMVQEAQRTVETEKKRNLAYYRLTEILAFHGMDYFVLRTFFAELANHNKFCAYPLDAHTVREQIRAVAAHLGPRVAPPGRKLPKHVTRFYVCPVHERLNASLVGTEMGDEEGMKNTRCYGHNGISVNLSDENCGDVFCTTSGKRADRRGASDAFWACVKRPNYSVDLLGQLFQLNDAIYVLCPHCGNPMEQRWERFCCGDLRFWCGQCVQGMRKMALQNGLIWRNGAVTPHARTNYIGGLPVLSDKCGFCMSSRESLERMQYVLMYDDTDVRGHHRLGYMPVCRDHQRPYPGESWKLSCRRFLHYVLDNRLCSKVLGFREPGAHWPRELRDARKQNGGGGGGSASATLVNRGGKCRVPVRVFVRGRHTPKGYMEDNKSERARRNRKQTRDELMHGDDTSERTVRRTRTKQQAKRELNQKLQMRKRNRDRRNKKSATTATAGAADGGLRD